MTKQTTEALIDSRLVWALASVKDMVPLFLDNRAEYPFSRNLGICGNVYYHLLVNETGMDIGPLMAGLHELMMESPVRDKSSDYYPVGGYDEYTSEQRMKKLWHNKHRLALLDWLIKRAAERVEIDLTAELAS